MLHRSWALSLLALLFFLAASVGPVLADERPVRIGGTLSFTGRYASIAEYQAQGFHLWVKDVNSRGGMLGRPVTLVMLDDKSDPQTAAVLYRRLMVEDRVDLLFAPYSSDITGAILQMTAVQGYPLIVSGASADRIWEKGHDHIFGLFLPASRFSIGFFEMLVRQGIGRVAIIHDQSSFAQDLAAGARRWADRFGVTVVHGEQFPQGLADFSGLAKKARDAGAQAVFLASYLDEAVRMRRAFTAIGWTPRAYYVPVGPGTGEYGRALGADADGVFSTSQWTALTRSRNGAGDPFFEAFVRVYGREPSYFAAAAYASGQIYEAAILKAGSLDRKAVRSALSIMDATSIIGRYGVDRAGVQIKNTNLIIQLQRGRREVVWPPEYQTAAPRFP